MSNKKKSKTVQKSAKKNFKGRITKNKNNKRTSKNKYVEKMYSIEDMKKALDAVGEGKSIRQAASMFGVPKTTLHSKFNNNTPIEIRKGPTTILKTEQEKKIVEWILECGEKGFPVTREQLLNCVQKFVQESGQKTPFKEGRPGKYWFYAFKKRHPMLSERIAQNLTTPRASVTEEELKSWFSKIKANLEAKNLLNIHPSRVFNADESSFMLTPKDNRVLYQKGARSVYKIVG